MTIAEGLGDFASRSSKGASGAGVYVFELDGKLYVGRTGRDMTERIREHERRLGKKIQNWQGINIPDSARGQSNYKSLRGVEQRVYDKLLKSNSSLLNKIMPISNRNKKRGSYLSSVAGFL